jgi:uncharacterized protein YoxC
MTEILVLIGLIILMIFLGFLVYLIFEMRRTIMAMREFISRTEENLNPALIEMKLTFESIRTVTDDIGSVTAEVRDISEVIGDVSKNVRKVSGIVDGVGHLIGANVAGLKAGIKTGLMTLFYNVIQRKEKKYEG